MAILNNDTNLEIKFYDINKNDHKDHIPRIFSIP